MKSHYYLNLLCDTIAFPIIYLMSGESEKSGKVAQAKKGPDYARPCEPFYGFWILS